MAEINITNVKKNPAPHPKEKGDISTGRKIFNQIATYCEKPDHIILIVFGIYDFVNNGFLYHPCRIRKHLF